MMRRALLLACLAAAIAPAQRVVLDAGLILDGRGGVLRNQQIVIEGAIQFSARPIFDRNGPVQKK